MEPSEEETSATRDACPCSSSSIFNLLPKPPVSQLSPLAKPLLPSSIPLPTLDTLSLLFPVGKWVLATTRSYLMVMKTTYKDPKTGKECCGFVSRMGANAPAPRLLRLKTQDVALTVRLRRDGREREPGKKGEGVLSCCVQRTEG